MPPPCLHFPVLDAHAPVASNQGTLAQTPEFGVGTTPFELGP
jgi:hypothetical protein